MFLIRCSVACAVAGSSDEARACRVSAWMLGHPSGAAVPIPQLVDGHRDEEDSSATRPLLLAAVRATDASLRSEHSRGAPLPYPPRVPPATHPPSGSGVGTRDEDDQPMTLALPPRVSMPGGAVRKGQQAQTLIVEVEETAAGGRAAEMFSSSRFSRPMAVIAFAGDNSDSLLDALVALACRRMPAPEAAAVIDADTGPTLLAATCAHCALRGALALASISARRASPRAAQAPEEQLVAGIVEVSDATRTAAGDALWRGRLALRTLLGAMRRWRNKSKGTDGDTHRRWLGEVVFRDLLSEIDELEEAASFLSAVAVAQAAADRDGRTEAVSSLVSDAAAVEASSRQRLAWTVKAVFGSLLPVDEANGFLSPVAGAGDACAAASPADMPWDFVRRVSRVQLAAPTVRKREKRAAAALAVMRACAAALESMDPLAPHWKRPKDSILARAALQRACFTLSQLSDDRASAALEANDHFLRTSLIAAASSLLHEHSESHGAAVQALATALLQRCVALGPQQSLQASERLAMQLVGLLDSPGAASSAAASLVASAAAAHPARILPRLFEKLNRSSPASEKPTAGETALTGRRNALKVLEELFALCSESSSPETKSSQQDFNSESGTGALLQLFGVDSTEFVRGDASRATKPTRGKLLSRELAMMLLDCLGDNDIGTRSQAAALVASLPPEVSVPRLFRLMLPRPEEMGIIDTYGKASEDDLDKDDEDEFLSAASSVPSSTTSLAAAGRRNFTRRRAAAERALRLLLTDEAAQTDPSAGLRALLDCLADKGEPFTEAAETSTAVGGTAAPAPATAAAERRTPCTPAELHDGGAVSPVATTPHEKHLSDRITSSLLPRWLKDVRARDVDAAGRSTKPGGRWSVVLQAISSRALASPDDPAAVRVLAKLAGCGLLTGSFEASAMASASIDAMRGQSRLTEELLSGTGSANVAILQRLLFVRLAPLLLLKTVPTSAWMNLDSEWRARDQHGRSPAVAVDSSADSETCGCLDMSPVSALAALLAERCTALYEFPDVCRVAAECLGRLPPRVALASIGAPFPATASADVSSVASALDDFLLGRPVIDAASSTSPGTAAALELLPAVQRSKALVYALCHALANHSDHLARLAETTGGDDGGGESVWWENTTARLFAALLVPCGRPSDARDTGSDDDELFKLQRGCIDALSFTLEVPFAKLAEQKGEDDHLTVGATRRLIEELRDDGASGPAPLPDLSADSSGMPLHSARAMLRRLMSTGVLPPSLHSRIASIVSASSAKGCFPPAFLSFPTETALSARAAIEPSKLGKLVPGARVQLRGLVGRPELNGLMGTVTGPVNNGSTPNSSKVSGSVEERRYSVRIDKMREKGLKAGSSLNVKSSNLRVVGAEEDQGRAVFDEAATAGLRGLRIIAANAHIATMQRCDPRIILPLVIRDALPDLLAAARCQPLSRVAGPGASNSLRAAALQALFVGTFRLAYGQPDAKDELPQPPATVKLLHSTAFVADTLAAALAAFPSSSLLSTDTLIRELKADESVQPDTAFGNGEEVEIAALKVLMALTAKIPGLFKAASPQGLGGGGVSLGGRSASLMKVVSLPPRATGILGGADGGSDSAAAAPDGYPNLDGPSVLVAIRSTVAAVASGRAGCGSKAVTQLAVQLLGALSM